jgi:hypothetical protein
VETIRRKVVASFTSRVHRVRFDVAVQTSNSYRFNIPVTDRAAHGDLALPLLTGSVVEPVNGPQPDQSGRSKTESKFQAEFSQDLKVTDNIDLPKAKAQWIRALLSTDKAG